MRPSRRCSMSHKPRSCTLNRGGCARRARDRTRRQHAQRSLSRQPKWPAASLRRPSRLLAPLVNVDGAALTIEAEGVNHGCPAALGSPWFVLRLLGGVGVMRKKLLVICGLFVLVGTIAVAAVLGTAGIGKAASTNTCALVGPSPGTPNCLTVGVFPGQLSPTGQYIRMVR